MNTVKKQPFEAFYISVTFPLGTGETISSIASSVLVEDRDGTDVSDTMIDTGTEEVVGAAYRARIIGGSPSASPYVMSFRVGTSLGNKYEYDVRIKVFETP